MINFINYWFKLVYSDSSDYQKLEANVTRCTQGVRVVLFSRKKIHNELTK